jgi:hypothetical protein
MRSVPVLLILVLLAVPVFAQTDFSVDVDGDARTPRLAGVFLVRASWNGSTPVRNVVLEADLPGDILSLSAWSQDMHCTTGKPVRCTMPAESAHQGGFAVQVRFPAAGSYTATARIKSDTPDPAPANNTDAHTMFAGGLPALQPYGRAMLPEITAVDPGGAGELLVGIQNDGEPATNVVLRALLPEGGRFTEPGAYAKAFCTLVSDVEVVCRFGEVRFGPPQVSLPFVAPDRAEGGTFPYRLTVDADQENFNPADDVETGGIPLRRLFAVTNGGDEGPGSLRQAILDSRVFCEDVSCLIGVRMAERPLIQPRTPLPEVRGRVKIDGGPLRAILDGTRLPAGDALRFEDGCEFRVTNLVIHAFKGHAIEARQKHTPGGPCEYNVLLTPLFVTNSEMIANVRGIVTKAMSATITDNVIRDHTRAGIFVDGAYYTDIARNYIVANGASGIFLHAEKVSPLSLPPGADITENFISGNTEWGIARTKQGAVSIARNHIFANGYYAIDWGLDLETPGAPDKPVLFSAVYDPARDATVIRGDVEFAYSSGASIQLYASSSLSRAGYPEAEQSIGNVQHRPGGFEAVVPGDLRGKWITATGSRVVDVLFLRDSNSVVHTDATFRYMASNTSELSNAVRVQ